MLEFKLKINSTFGVILCVGVLTNLDSFARYPLEYYAGYGKIGLWECYEFFFCAK